MKPETRLRHDVVGQLKCFHACPIENMVGTGTPDVECVRGWVELKRLPAWPVRAKTLVRIPHWNQGQKIWHFDRSQRGGISYVLLQVRSDYLLFKGLTAYHILGETTKNDLFDAACFISQKGMNWQAFRVFLNNAWLEHWNTSDKTKLC